MKQEITEKLETLYPRVFGYAMSWTKNKDSAHDLVMEVYIKILENFRKTNKLPEPLEFYTMRAIRNKRIDMVRASERIDYIDDVEGYLEPVEESIPSDPFLKKRIARALGTLNENCREILWLSAQGWGYSEIKEIIGKPYNTVASRLSRCRQQFRHNLYGSEQEREQA
jgi:RNA polymerase sigma factor (sigma-70 family)